MSRHMDRQNLDKSSMKHKVQQRQLTTKRLAQTILKIKFWRKDTTVDAAYVNTKRLLTA